MVLMTLKIVKSVITLCSIAMLSIPLISCCYNEEAIEEGPPCYTCNNFVEAYVFGFDPCSGIYDVDNKSFGFIIAIPSQKDTVLAYNLSFGIYNFPTSYFANYRSICIFPDSALNKFPLKLKYRLAKVEERYYPGCNGDVYLGDFNGYVDNKNKQVIILQSFK